MSYIVAAIPIASDLKWMDLDRVIDPPKGMRFERQRLRFIIPTEVILRDFTHQIPEIGCAWETNLVFFDGKIMLHEDAQTQLCAEAKLVNEDLGPYDGSDAYYKRRDVYLEGLRRINQRLTSHTLWAVEMWEPCGDDGHVDHRFQGYALVHAGVVKQYISEMIGGRYGLEVTWV
jgi:hypothetical protein